MTDVFIAYAREDRDRLRLLTEMLCFEGWDVWIGAPDGAHEQSSIVDMKLASAGAVLAVWSDRSRTSEAVRAEAASGLYKNKLIQVRIDGGAPPRPFDQVEAFDLAHWRGDQDDSGWRRLNAALRAVAGEPQATRPAPVRRQPQPAPLQPPPAPPELRRFSAPPEPVFQRAAPPDYREPLAERPVVDREPPAPPRAARSPVYGEVSPPARPAPLPTYREEPPPPPRPTYREPPLAPVPEPYRPPAPPPPSPPPPPYVALEKDAPVRRSAYAPTITYGDPQRRMAWGPIAAAAVLIVSGVGLWLGDPFGWRAGSNPEGGDTLALAARTVGDAPIANSVPASASFEDSAESNADWARVNRKSPEALRDFALEFPRASTAETARSVLRVLDAQAWVTAVTADNEPAYRAYLDRFPADGGMPGAMAAAARDRLVSLGGEREAAIEDLQRGLAALNLYGGAIDGKGGGATLRAAQTFAASTRRAAPALETASPRDLRAFSDAVRRAGSPGAVNREIAAAGQADIQRVADAQALAASLGADQAAGAADSLALTQQRRIADANAWEAAETSGTLAGYRAYLADWPEGARAAMARAAVARLDRPAPFSLDQVSSDVRNAVDAARRAQATANQKATAARQAASAAVSVADARSIVGAGGDRYDAQIANGAPNGLGVRVRGAGVNAGDRYRGELRNGQSAGVGVYEFADNQASSASGALRYEGEHARDTASGHGVMHWRSGDSFAGLNAGSAGQARGVLSYGNGQRYEGEMMNGERNGFGVVWSSDGAVVQAGRWVKDQLVDPAKAPPG